MHKDMFEGLGGVQSRLLSRAPTLTIAAGMDVIQARRSSVGRLPKWAMRRIRGFARSLGLVDDPPAIPQERIVALTSPTMRDVAHAVNAAPADIPLHGVAGWLTRNEGRALYAIARTLDGPF